jgi:hypothetical protein
MSSNAVVTQGGAPQAVRVVAPSRVDARPASDTDVRKEDRFHA